MTSPADAAWTRFERALDARLPALHAALAPPSGADALAALADTAGAALAEAAAALYARHDGQRSPAPGLFFGLHFLSAAEAAREWQRWADLLADQPEIIHEVTVRAHPEGAVQPVYASAAWLPFASDGAGNHLALDLAPGASGTPGQVITFGPDEAVRYVLAPSVAAFLDACADALETGRAEAAADPDAPGGVALRLAGAAHPFDVLPDGWAAVRPA